MHAPWKRGKHVAVIAGLGFLGVLGAAVAFRADLETWYHFERLRRDPAHFLAIAGEPERTPEHAALERYVAREEGKEALLRAFVSQLGGMVKASQIRFVQNGRSLRLELDGNPTVVFVIQVPVTFCDGVLFRQIYELDAHESYGSGAGHRTYEGLLRLLPALGEGKHVLQEEPEASYDIWRTDGVITVVTTLPEGSSPR